MALAYYSFKFTVEVELPHDIASFLESEVFIPDTKCMKYKGNVLTPDLYHVEVHHDDDTIDSWDVED